VKPFILSGRTALVTGGTRGIGYAIAQRLIADGADVLVTGRQPIGNGPSGSEYLGVDFADQQAVDVFSDSMKKRQIDILINNAGVNKIGNFSEIDQDEFRMIQQVNLHAPFCLSQAVVEGMKSRAWGRIVNIASIWSKISKELRASYSASKFALDGMTVAMSAELARYGVLVNCVSPGFIDTDMTRQVLGKDGMKALAEMVPARRLGAPEEIANFVAWLAGPENTYISGQNIAIDGGFTRV